MPRVNPDASLLVSRLFENGTASVAAHDFVALAGSADTAVPPLGPSDVWLFDYTRLSSTVGLGRSASTPPPGIRIHRNTTISRRPLVHCLLLRETSAVRVGNLCPILITRGSFPGAAAGLVDRPLGPAAGFCLSNGLSPTPTSCSQTKQPTPTG